jgi:hypothetical protein
MVEDVTDLQARPSVRGDERAGDRDFDAAFVPPRVVVRVNEVAERPVRAIERATSERETRPRIRGDDSGLPQGASREH